MPKTLRVKLYGNSVKIYRLKIGSKDYHKFREVANKLRLPISEALLTLDFYRLLKLDGFKSIEDIKGYSIGGLLNNNQNTIEITFGRKRVEKFVMEDLFRPSTLFPLYNTKMASVVYSGQDSCIYLLEKEVGLVGIYEMTLEEFDIANIQFHLIKLTIQNVGYELLNKITYNKLNLKLIKEDLLLTYQNIMHNRIDP